MVNGAVQPDGRARPRVLLLAPQTNWIYQNFIPSLRRTCSMVYACPLGDHMGNWQWPRWRELRQQFMDCVISDVRALVNGPGLDLVLTVLYDDAILPQEVRRMRDLGVRVVTYHVDMNRQWYRVLRHAPQLDLLAVSHMQNLEPLIRRGTPVHFMPMAACPDRYAAAVDDKVPAHGVLMLGSATQSRIRAVAACRGVTDQVDVYGGLWDKLRGGADPQPRKKSPAQPLNPQPLAKRRFDLAYLLPRLLAEGSSLFRSYKPLPLSPGETAAAAQARFHGYAPDEIVPSLMARAAITLGVNQRLGEIGDRFGFADSRLRDFEAPLSGAFYLVQSFVDLPLFYRPGIEVETWSTLEELKAKVRYYLGHPDQRRAIAAAGRERALLDHTWDARLSALFHRLGLAHAAQQAPAPLRVVRNLSSQPWCGDSPGCSPASDEPSALVPQITRDGVWTASAAR